MKTITLAAIAAATISVVSPVAAAAHDEPGFSASLGASASAHDNIFAGPNNEVSDTVYGVSGHINWSQRGDGGSFGVWGSFDLERYQDFSDEDADDYGVGLKGSANFGQGSVSGGASHELNTEDRRARTARRDTKERTEYTTDSAHVSLTQRFGAMAVTGGLAATMLDYDDTRLRTTLAPVDQDFRDRTVFSQSLKLSFPAENSSFFLSAQHRDIDYDLAPPASLHQRDSDHAQVVAGVDFEAMPNLTGTLEVGWASRSFDNPGFDDVSTVAAHADLRWTPGPETTFRFFAERQIEESVLPGSSSYVATTIGGSVNHSFGEVIGIRLSMQKEWDAHEGIDRDDDVWEAAVGVTADITSNVQAAFTYTLTTEESDGAFASPGYDVGIAGLSLTASF